MTDLPARLLAGLGSVDRLGLAVSGGGDSMAMLHLAVAAGLRPDVVTVDHGLRVEAAAEAAMVGQVSAGYGLRHDTLRWQGWDHSGNLQNEARKARRRLMAEWALGRGVGAIALAHTQDDVGETFLMRLARGAGVDGLAAMAPVWAEAGVTWVRPMLAMTRAELRAWLTWQGLTWAEDPSNENLAFDRIKVRKALPALGAMGLTSARLAEVAGHMAEARLALEQATQAASVQTLSLNANAVCIDPLHLADETPEVQRRLILRVIAHLSPAEYGPRGPAVQALLARVVAGKPATLAGCRFVPDRKRLCFWAFREVKAVADQVCRPDQLWDGWWRITGPAPDGAQVRILGSGIALCPDWRAAGVPRAALLASPAVWLHDSLIAAPHAGFRASTYSAVPLHPWLGRNVNTLSH